MKKASIHRSIPGKKRPTIETCYGSCLRRPTFVPLPKLKVIRIYFRAYQPEIGKKHHFQNHLFLHKVCVFNPELSYNIKYSVFKETPYTANGV